MKVILSFFILLPSFHLFAQNPGAKVSLGPYKDATIVYKPNSHKPGNLLISRANYYNKLYGFWLGECIANWTGLVTEMDKIGNIGTIQTGRFYTRADWGKKDQPNIWSNLDSKQLSPTIDFVFENADGNWGADDDTDIEYIYQELMYGNKTTMLTGRQIRDGWLKHIKHEEENFLWVSNQQAFDLMLKGMEPPLTGRPENNPDYEMIDAQLTTEIFGLYAPAFPETAVKLATLPIQTTASNNAEIISQFYVRMYSLASKVNSSLPMKEQILWMAKEARKKIPNDTYVAKMFDFVKSQYDKGIPWEQTRDAVYDRYQVQELDGYHITSMQRYCNGCYAAGINFASSIISLLYGEGDFKETIKLGSLMGWDSDNPTATWGGLLGFMIGKDGIEKAFGKTFSNKFNIHRTRTNFPNNGIDTFESMAKKGIAIVDRVVQEELKGTIDVQNGWWSIPPSF